MDKILYSKIRVGTARRVSRGAQRLLRKTRKDHREGFVLFRGAQGPVVWTPAQLAPLAVVLPHTRNFHCRAKGIHPNSVHANGRKLSWTKKKKKEN